MDEKKRAEQAEAMDGLRRWLEWRAERELPKETWLNYSVSVKLLQNGTLFLCDESLIPGPEDLLR